MTDLRQPDSRTPIQSITTNGVAMTDKIDIEAIWKENNGYRYSADGNPPFWVKRISVLLSHIAAIKAAHEAELLEFAEYVMKETTGMELRPKGGSGIFLAAYRAQKEKKDV